MERQHPAFYTWPARFAAEQKGILLRSPDNTISTPNSYATSTDSQTSSIFSHAGQTKKSKNNNQSTTISRKKAEFAFHKLYIVLNTSSCLSFQNNTCGGGHMKYFVASEEDDDVDEEWDESDDE